MSPAPTATTATDRVEADINLLESKLKQLKVQYDMFFAGSLSHEPIQLRSQVEKLIRHHTHTGMRNYAHRFHFNALVSRFNSLSELWAKTIRTMEEGNRRQPALADRPQPRERLIARARVTDGEVDGEPLRRIYSRYVSARESTGETKRQISYEKFVRGISAQTRNLRKESGCAEIEVRVVLTDHKVQVKARPAR
jgi:hypothetical protein